MQCIKEDCYSIPSSDLTTYSNTARRVESPSIGWTPPRRPVIILSHGAAWNALISRYISVIPLIPDEPCIAMQGMSGWPLNKPVHSAMMANVGAAARPSQPAAPEAARPPPAQVSTS